MRRTMTMLAAAVAVAMAGWAWAGGGSNWRTWEVTSPSGEVAYVTGEDFGGGSNWRPSIVALAEAAGWAAIEVEEAE